MINNQDDLNKYTAMNKIYIPNNLINQNYSYRINGDFIDIITNQSCYTNYNTTYCNCYRYNYKNNITTDVYSCSTNNNNPVINYQLITNDINYSEVLRERFIQDKGIVLLMIILGILFAIFLTKERKHI